MLSPLINQLTALFRQLTGRLTPLVFSQSTLLLSAECWSNLWSWQGVLYQAKLRDIPALYMRAILQKYKSVFRSFERKNQLKPWSASKLSGGSGSKSEAAKMYLPNFPFQKGKECQLPTEATLAASVCRRKKCTLPPSTDSWIVLFNNSLVANLIR